MSNTRSDNWRSNRTIGEHLPANALFIYVCIYKCIYGIDQNDDIQNGQENRRRKSVKKYELRPRKHRTQRETYVDISIVYMVESDVNSNNSVEDEQQRCQQKQKSNDDN